MPKIISGENIVYAVDSNLMERNKNGIRKDFIPNFVADKALGAKRC
jgi:hypothetical protein